MAATAKGACAAATVSRRSIVPALSHKALRLRGTLWARTGAESAAPALFVSLALSCPEATAGRVPGRNLRSPELARLVGELNAGTTLRVLCGGSADASALETVLFEADKRDIVVEVATTGTRLYEIAPVIYGLSASSVLLRLVGGEDAHNRAVGVPTAFQDAIRGMLALRGLRGQERMPALTIEVAVSQATQGHLREVVQCALAAGADRVVIRHAAPAGTKGIEAVFLAEELRMIKARWREGIAIQPGFTLDEMIRYYGGRASTMGPRRCFAPWKSVSIRHDGEVFLCGTESIGSLSAQPLSEVFNGPAARAIRVRLRRGVCGQCMTCARRFGADDSMI